jgi:hypothetical protein
LSKSEVKKRKAANLDKISSWYAQRADQAIDYLQTILDQHDDLRLGMEVARDVLAHNGSISPLAKIPETALVQNLVLDPRTIDTMSRHLESMSEGDALMRASLRPIGQITSGRHASLSEAALAEPDRQPEEIVVGPPPQPED